MASQDFFNSLSRKVLLEYLMKELERLLGVSAPGVAYKIIKDAAKDAAPGINVEIKDACDLFKFVYSAFGHEEVECERLDDGTYKIIVRNCPLIKEVSEPGRACLTLGAMKSGILEALEGKRVLLVTREHKYGYPKAELVVEKVKSIAWGDPYCEFIVKEK